jgi:hypothetical protein
MVSIETWMFVASNVLVFAIGGSLAVLSYRAQRQVDNEKLRYTTLGFLLVTASTLVEARYTPGLVNVDRLGNQTLLLLYTIESLLVAAGLGSIAYAILRY